MADPLNVLVLESERGAADIAREELTAAGHTVLRCHEPGASAFPCNALVAGRGCPLETAIVDVALDVRSRPRSQPAPQEDGVRCVIQRHVPLVVAGSAALNPYNDYAVEVLGRTYDVVEACERAAREPLREHSVAAAEALGAMLAGKGIAATPAVAVRRQHGTLVVEVSGADALDEPTKHMGSVRMTGAVRTIDRDARGIDVVFR